MNTFSNLPDQIKQQVMHLLQTDNFPAAKELYEQHKQADLLSQNDCSFKNTAFEQS